MLSDDASVIFYQSDYIGPSVRSNPLYLVGLYGSGSSLQALKEVRSPKHKRVVCSIGFIVVLPSRYLLIYLQFYRDVFAPAQIGLV